jgi:tripartite-type tricarboxylate transporter receptor subunit TctC
MTLRRRLFTQATLFNALAFAGSEVSAQQAWPNKPVRIVVPFAPVRPTSWRVPSRPS